MMGVRIHGGHRGAPDGSHEFDKVSSIGPGTPQTYPTSEGDVTGARVVPMSRLFHALIVAVSFLCVCSLCAFGFFSLQAPCQAF